MVGLSVCYATYPANSANGKRAERERMSELVQLVAERKDKSAFRELFLHYAPRIKALMMRQGADPETAEEIAQETMLTVWRKAGLFVSAKGNASTWIFTIARNLRIDRIRREIAWQATVSEAPEEFDDELPPDEAVAQAQEHSQLRGIIAQLPPDQNEVVKLSYVSGLSHSEIAEQLDIPLGTVKSRIRLAYQKIRESLEEGI